MRVPSNRVLHLGWKIDNVQHGALGLQHLNMKKLKKAISYEFQKKHRNSLKQKCGKQAMTHFSRNLV